MKPQIRVFENIEKLSHAAAGLFAEQTTQSVTERGRCLVALNGGGTPSRLFQILADEFRDKVDWSQVHVFWGDERCVLRDDPGSSYGQARELLLDHVPIPGENIHRIRGELEPREAAYDYALILKGFASPPLAWPRFDL